MLSSGAKLTLTLNAWEASFGALIGYAEFAKMTPHYARFIFNF